MKYYLLSWAVRWEKSITFDNAILQFSKFPSKEIVMKYIKKEAAKRYDWGEGQLALLSISAVTKDWA